MILDQELWAWDKTFSSESLIIPLADPDLFGFLLSEEFEFAELHDSTTVVLSNERTRRNPGSVKRKFKMSCHRVSIRARKYKFLRLATYEPPIDMLDGNLDLRLDKDNSVLARVIKVREFIFTEEDYELLSRYREKTTAYVAFGQNYLNFAYIKAENRASNHLNIDMKDGITSMVKKFAPSTIEHYGATLAPMLFLLFNAYRLSSFDKHPFLANHDISLLKQDIEGRDNIEQKTKVLGRCFHNCLRDNDHREYMARWVRMCAFNFPAWEGFDAPCPENTVTKARRLMDTVRCLLIFTCFATTENISETAYWFTSRAHIPVVNFWGWFRRLYHKVAKEEGIEASSRVTVNPTERTVCVEGKSMSFEYVTQMKMDLNSALEAQVALLQEWLEFGSVSDVYTTVMGNKSISVIDDLSGRGSVFNIIDISAVGGYCIRFREQENAENEQVCSAILKIINTITKLLMVSIWISPGLALRFTELSILSFSGSHRNLYFDSDDRVFIIRSRYNKNTKYDTRLLFLNPTVSAQLFWFIYVLRPFTITLLGDGISRTNTAAVMGALTPQEPLGETHSVEEEADEINFNAELYHHQMEVKNRLKDATPLEIWNAIFKSMVFLDLKKMAMVNRSTFSNMLLKYPSATPTRESHRILSLRQGLSALWKHFIAPRLYDEMLHLGQEVARGFGHSVAIDLAAYGFDSARSVGPGEVPFASAKKLCQIFQRLTQSARECKRSVEKEGTIVAKGEGSVGDYFDLCQAGAQVIAGFSFRSVEQERFTSMVLTAIGQSSRYRLQPLLVRL